MDIRLNWNAILALGIPLLAVALVLVWLFGRFAAAQFPQDKSANPKLLQLSNSHSASRSARIRRPKSKAQVQERVA